jgi:hypothetical protein
MVLIICVVALLILILVLALTCGGGDNTGSTTTTGGQTDTTLVSATYTAELTGAESVPPVATQAAATFTLAYDADKKKLTYELRVTSPLTNPSVAAIYQGTADTEHGEAVYTLFAGPAKEGSFTGLLPDETTDNNIIDADLVGPLAGKTVADLIGLIKDGDAYVSIGNESHPVDAIRGQIGGQISDPFGGVTTTQTTE